MPLTALAEQIAIQALNRGWADQDHNVVFRLQEEAVGVEVRAPQVDPRASGALHQYASRGVNVTGWPPRHPPSASGSGAVWSDRDWLLSGFATELTHQG